ncbi:hypothetical protein GI374_01645 [Paracoccus sp. S-4012]|uniref:hypothetical protein n=1 Tax=Paracoccus sp. S-4012 TaxID=2665648 RepID=UPI0012AEEF2C|nr:hypothetical protein [Paracoccus sp. S-4012]MRX49162.1 hypothetical protein [Paracoccus sp. S-4012]
MLTSDDIAALFTRDDRFLCSRWARPIVPVMFGLADDSLAVFQSAIPAVLADARIPMAETDPETGANLMGFFLRDWAELEGFPDLDQLTGFPDLPARLAAEGVARYRLFRFDAEGAIRACLTFVRVTDEHPAALAESLAVNALLTFAREVTPSPDLAALIRAAYDPVLPAVATDASHALRLGARLA